MPPIIYHMDAVSRYGVLTGDHIHVYKNVIPGETCTYPDSVRVLQRCTTCGDPRQLHIRTPAGVLPEGSQ